MTDNEKTIVFLAEELRNARNDYEIYLKGYDALSRKIEKLNETVKVYEDVLKKHGINLEEES